MIPSNDSAATPAARDPKPARVPAKRVDKSSSPNTKAKSAKQSETPKRGSKKAKIIALLKRPGGAALEQLQKATGWQALGAGLLEWHTQEEDGAAHPFVETPRRPPRIPHPVQVIPTPPSPNTGWRRCSLCSSVDPRTCSPFRYLNGFSLPSDRTIEQLFLFQTAIHAV